MAKSNPTEILWLPDVAEHNYPAAAAYLTLLYPDAQVARLITRLQRTALRTFKAKDIFRASQLSLLGVSNSHVERDQQKIRAGTALSPILLVRTGSPGKVVVADGYHRLCAVYTFDEDALVPCKLVDSP